MCWHGSEAIHYSCNRAVPTRPGGRYFGMQRLWVVSGIVPVLLIVAVVTIRNSTNHDSNIVLESKSQLHTLAQSKSTGLLGDYEKWKHKSSGKSVEGIVLEEPKLNDALSGLTKINVKKGSKKAAALLKAQTELRRVLAETASDQKLGQSAIEGTE